ncbi:hypothetical protein LOK49_LG02G01763 [Camellia lanceoleosa]|uniref:Uncharacterized protein n=1 Tax=Camellia lanceoleosa TaxID=1840588 RepID=A0ACC0IHT5_9ERIC|nr:hypothetical protein LOK49_LG02G01763 [Camellia lanceoleosa]
MEDFEKKVTITDSDSMEAEVDSRCDSSKIIGLLRRILEIQERRAQAYAKLKKVEHAESLTLVLGMDIVLFLGLEMAERMEGLALYFPHKNTKALEAWGEACGFIAWTEGVSWTIWFQEESVYQQLCSEITVEFNECSKQVLEMESLFLSPDCFRDDLARLVRSIQVQEKQKLQLTATIQVLKKAGRPSERLVSHENCGFKRPMQHECVHVHEITEAAGTEEAEADAEYDNALKEAIRGVQDAVTTINEHLEEVRYEIAALEAE